MPPMNKRIVCPKCEGDGEYRNVLQFMTKCEMCNGTGEITKEMIIKNNEVTKDATNE